MLFFQCNSLTPSPVDNSAAVTFKAQTLYVAFAPRFNVSAYGGCRDEALNNLTDELHQLKEVGEATGKERK